MAASLAPLLAGILACIQPLPASGQTPQDRISSFESDSGGWNASDPTAVLTWSATGGDPGGCLKATRSGSTNAWHFTSPNSWAGNWSSYRVIKFDFSIPSRHYPDIERGQMVVIVGNNGQEMAWTGSTPLWTWTHYEITLSPAAFNVDQTTFNSIMASVAQVRILAEFNAFTETVGLDNVLLTSAEPEAHATSLASRFTDSTTQGWRPVDDTTLTVQQQGKPSFCLMGDDWKDGRYFKFASPTAWAGDWRQFKELSFDFSWTGEYGSHTNMELVRVIGANGHTLSWSNAVTSGAWTHHRIPLNAGTFGVSEAFFAEVMAHVTELWIFGEFDASDDITLLDNIVVSPIANEPPKTHTQNLLARFDEDKEGWVTYDGSTLTWSNNFGVSGGGLRSVDAVAGNARFQTPDAWAGDWRGFKTLRFMVRPEVPARDTYNMVLWINTWRGPSLTLTLPKPYGSWTPYTVELTPETFGVTENEFETVMGNVACMWILAELSAGSLDAARLDSVLLLTESAEAGLPPERISDFETGNQNWRYGGWNVTPQDWNFSGLAPHSTTGGNPDGFLRNTDTGDWTYWFTPESWAGDWRGLQTFSFDFKIITGTAANLYETRMISLCSAWTNLHANVVEMPIPGQWQRFEFSLRPETFGVSQELFDKVMRDAVLLGIRSEWILGSEVEGLDNARLTKATDAYWTWMGQWFTGPELANEDITGKYADPDGDRTDNWSEYIAGTSPTNSLDRLRIEHCISTNSVNWIGFNSYTGRRYTLEAKATLDNSSNWEVLATDLAGIGGIMGVTETNTAVQRFFRLKVRQ